MADPTLDGWLKALVDDIMGDEREVLFAAKDHPRMVAAFRSQLDLPIRSKWGGSGHYRVRAAPKNYLVSVTLMPQDGVDWIRLRRYG